ncbi:MAG TPA: sugar ABC transporter ATP-binding protein [Planosporangium sp.]|jgi:simple sugar transport system ATP-binding protein|nr:sugar ABC transporter ATP-binding protein [Planosporangium sp.]
MTDPAQGRDLDHRAARAGRPVVEATAVGKRYGNTAALADVTLAVRPGESHALVGRNGAGKSTLVSILTGLQAPDGGEVRFAGEPAPPLGNREAWRQRVACVYQKSTVIPALSVAENLYLNRQADRGLISWRKLRTDARAVLDEWSLAVDPAQPAGDLNVEQQQMLEIARALSHGARFIILDEPTAQLDGAAIQRLFRRLRGLQEQGVTFMFISHHLDEIYEVCQAVTVLRDGRHVVTAPVGEMPRPRLVEAMTGEARGLIGTGGDRPAVATDAPVALDARGLRLPGEYEQVYLTVRAGEVVGLAGGGASGALEVGETIVGLRAARGGAIEIAGRKVRPGSVPAAMAAGVGFVPRDRHTEGFVPALSVAENATLSIADRLGRFGWIAPGRRRALAERFVRDLDIKTDGPDQPVSGLSGGNQQKVVMARALSGEPRVLVLLSPTAGVDVRSKESLLGIVDSCAATGAAVLVVSDEVDDLRVCDRVTVMFRGRVVGEYPRGWSDHELVAAMEGVSGGSGR